MKKTIHLVCNAHLDLVWQWTWKDGLAEVVSTFHIAADFCEKHLESGTRIGMDSYMFDQKSRVPWSSNPYWEAGSPEVVEKIKLLMVDSGFGIGLVYSQFDARYCMNRYEGA